MTKTMKKMPEVLLAAVIAVAFAFAIGTADAQTVYADVEISGLYVGDSAEVTATGEISDTGATSGTATVSVDEDNNSIVLTLKDFTYKGPGYVFDDAAIYYNNYNDNTVPLIIQLEGDNSAVCTAEDGDGIVSISSNATITSKSDGTLDVKGEKSGIYLMDSVTLTINGGAVTATGSTKAIDGKVKNAISGHGWSNMEGTQPSALGEAINTNTEGQRLDYKKVVFAPAHKHKDAEGNEITFQPWGSTVGLPDEPGNYYLTCDVTIDSGWRVYSTINLCLNGNSITCLDSVDGAIQINSSTLSLYNCGTDGTITHAPEKTGSGVCVYGGTFNMYGGTICGNSATGNGGGVCLKQAVVSFNMYGGTIRNNSATKDGGGVYSYGTFNMIGGTISNNNATRSGGGVYLFDNSLTMSSGTIRDNKAQYGGGVCTEMDISISGGTITNNTGSGGGIYISYNKTIYLSGSPQITGNTFKDKANNIFMMNGAKAVITGELTTPKDTSGPQIGVTMNVPDVFTSELKNNLPSGKTVSDLFFSDSTDYIVRETTDGEAQLFDTRVDIASGTCSFDDATYAGEEISSETMTLKLSDTDIRKLKLGTDYEITEYKTGGTVISPSKPKYVGTYTATVKGIGKYKGEATVGFKIRPAPLTITANDQSYVYNGYEQGEGDPAYDDPAVIAEKVTAEGLQGTDVLTGLIMTGTAKEVGVYPGRIQITGVEVGNATGNYDIKYVDGTLTITKAKPKPTPPQPKPDPQPQPTIDKAAAKIALDAGIVARSSGNKVTASWGAVKGASSYVIYANYCDQKKCKKIRTVSGKTTSFNITKLNGKKFNPKKNLKFYVVAYQKVNGKKVKLAKSIMAHAPGSKNSKRTNVTGVKVKKASFTLKKGKTAKIKAKLVLQKKGKKPLKHCAKFRYASSNKKVAKVSKKGKITAVGKGKCTVYVYAVSGVSKKIKVTVK